MGNARFVVYEHQRLVVGDSYETRRGPVAFTEAHFEALARYQERTGTAALRLGHRSHQGNQGQGCEGRLHRGRLSDGASIRCSLH